MPDELRGRVVDRYEREGRYRYVVRCLMIGEFRMCEASFLTSQKIPFGTLQADATVSRDAWTCEVGGRHYELAHYQCFRAGEDMGGVPPSAADRMAALVAARAMDVGIAFYPGKDRPQGRWGVRVRTKRGQVFVQGAPGETWDEILAAAGLLATVPS